MNEEPIRVSFVNVRVVTMDVPDAIWESFQKELMELIGRYDHVGKPLIAQPDPSGGKT